MRIYNIFRFYAHLPAVTWSFDYKIKMKCLLIISQVVLIIFLSVNMGCQNPAGLNETNNTANNDVNKLPTYALYAPSKIDIMLLTEFSGTGNAQKSKIDIYVSLLDQFGSQIKSPGIFRFELYEHVSRSAEPKGKRVKLWQDIDLTDPTANNNCWRDFLRAYQFALPYEPAGNQDYIIQLTCMCPNGKRLSSEFTLKKTK
jgi:hypothetical protein